jgi:hypothetical protein
VLLVWLTPTVCESPPTPVTEAVHGVSAAPVYVTLVGQVTTVADVAFSIVNVLLSVLVMWLASPAYV